MSVESTIEGLTGIGERLAGSDAERRATLWLARELRRSGLPVRVETFWCRPNWALAQAWHVALGLAGSLVSVGAPRLGGGLVLLAALCVMADVLTARSPGRLLTRERASQNLISRRAGDQSRITLLITANLDAGRAGLIHRPRLRQAAAAVRRALGDRAPGWAAWLTLDLVWVLATAIARAQGGKGSLIGALQLAPTVLLVLILALLLDQATAAASPAASDNASGSAVALALTRALSVSRPAHLNVELVLQGSGDAQGLGLRRHLRRHRKRLRPQNTVVLGLAACGGGSHGWWLSEGPLLPLRTSPQIVRLAAVAAARLPGPAAAMVRTRAATPAHAALQRRIPAISLGAFDHLGLAPRSHTAADAPANLDRSAVERTLQLALLLVDELGAHLASAGRPSAATTPAAAIPA